MFFLDFHGFMAMEESDTVRLQVILQTHPGVGHVADVVHNYWSIARSCLRAESALAGCPVDASDHAKSCSDLALWP